MSNWLYDRYPGLRERQSPKELFIPIGALGWAQERLQVQLVRIGGLHLVCLPIEVMVNAGLRLRRVVAVVMSTDVEHVIVQGYANGYAHYLTTPEEYDEQDYEGSSTILRSSPAGSLRRAGVTGLAEAMRDRQAGGRGRTAATAPAVVERADRIATARAPAADRRALGPASIPAGWTARVEVAADHPNRVLRPTYLLVERETPAGWEVVADDSSFDTSITWRRRGRRWDATITWLAGDPGTYRIAYVGRETVRTSPFTVTLTQNEAPDTMVVSGPRRAERIRRRP